MTTLSVKRMLKNVLWLNQQDSWVHPLDFRKVLSTVLFLRSSVTTEFENPADRALSLTTHMQH